MSSFEVIEGKWARARQGQLQLRRANGRHSVVPWIRGLGLRATGAFDDWEFRIDPSGLVVEFSTSANPGVWKPYLPGFSRQLTLSLTVPRPRSLPISIVAKGDTRFDRAATNLVEAEHYLSAPARGLTVVALCADDNLRRALRRTWAKKNGVSVDSLEANYGSVVGALKLDRLGHGSPLGRTELARVDGARLPPNAPADRATVLRTLGLYWISRVVSDPAFKGAGIGAALCDAAREIATARMAETGRWIELMRRAPVQGEPDFLLDWQGRFGLSSPFCRATPTRSKRGDLAYYYAPTGSMVIK